MGDKPKSRAVTSHHYSKPVDEFINAVLSETPTQSLFFMQSLIISTEAKDVGLAQDRNAKYALLIEAHKNPDGNAGRSTQTINDSQKNQNEMTVSNTMKDSGCQAASFDIIDANNQMNETDSADTDILGNSAGSSLDRAGLTSHVKKFVDSTISVSLAASGCLLNTAYVKPVEINIAKKSGKGTVKTSSTGVGTVQEKAEKGSDSNIVHAEPSDQYSMELSGMREMQVI